MQLPVEYLQTLLIVDEAPSALKIWLDLFKGTEPTHFATDEDGDTNARGPYHGYWVDIHRVNDSVHLFATPVERKTSHDRSMPFDNEVWPKVLNELIGLASTIAGTADVLRIGVNVICGKPYARVRDAIAAYRELGPAFALLPENAIDARYDFTVIQNSKTLADVAVRRGSQYRVGRRSVADPDGGYEASDGTIVSWQTQMGHVITVGTRGTQDKPIDPGLVHPTFIELEALAATIWEAGANAFA